MHHEGMARKDYLWSLAAVSAMALAAVVGPHVSQAVHQTNEFFERIDATPPAVPNQQTDVFAVPMTVLPDTGEHTK